MKTYQILIFIALVMTSQWAWGQEGKCLLPNEEIECQIEYLETTPLERPFRDCMTCENVTSTNIDDKVVIGSNHYISCTSTPTPFRTSGSGQVELGYRDINNAYKRFPTHVNSSRAVVVEGRNQSVGFEITSRRYDVSPPAVMTSQFDVYVGRFRASGASLTDVTHLFMGNNGEHSAVGHSGIGGTTINLSASSLEYGLYLIYVGVRQVYPNSVGGQSTAEFSVSGWIAVRPTFDEVNNFSACYIGPDVVCPTDNCDCAESELPDGFGDDDYYPNQPSLLYQAKIDFGYHGNPTYNYFDYYTNRNWFNNIEDPESEDILRQFGTNSPASREVEPINYRLSGPIEGCFTYRESIYVVKVKEGVKTEPIKVCITRNIRPLPLYDYELGCFGHEIKLYNQTQLYGAEPAKIKYTWHLGDGSRKEYPNDIDDVNKQPNEDEYYLNRQVWADLPFYEYENEGDYTPVLQVEYTYNEDICPVRSIYSRPEYIQTKLIENEGLPAVGSGDDRVTQLYIRPTINPDPEDKPAVPLPVRVRSLELEGYNTPYMSYTVPNTLGASAASFADSWVMDLGSTNVRDKHPFVNGQRGLWRGEGAFAYIDNRLGAKGISNNTAVETRNFGTFTLNSFNWNAHAGPKWVKANTITEYSPYGSEIENKDVLNRYSTAIFGYNGQLTTAVAANMQNNELAFTSFEEGKLNNFQASDAGNFNLVNQGGAALRKIPVLGANQDIGIIQYPFRNIDQLRELSKTQPLTLSGTNLSDGKSFLFDDIYLSCKFRHSKDEEKTIVGFTGAGLDILGKPWKGTLSYYEETPITMLTSDVAEIVKDKANAHTGIRSLKISKKFLSKQYYLELIDNKEYVISAWIKVGDLTSPIATYQTLPNENETLATENKLGIVVKLSDEEDAEYVALLEPSGPIIEGWQRIQGKFKYPEGATQLYIGFQMGRDYVNTKPIYLDDIRFFANLGNMQSYVYDRVNYRLKATLDNNNFATLYSYDSEGNLFLIKKETVRGVKTIQESLSHQKGEDGN